MKRISIIVIGAHALLLLWMALWMPIPSVRKEPLVIRTVTQIEPPILEQKTTMQAHQVSQPMETAAPAVAEPAKVEAAEIKTPTKKTLTQKPAPKKAVVKKAAAEKPVFKKTAPKKPAVSPNLIAQLQESIAKIDQKSHKGGAPKRSSTSKFLTGLTVDEGSSGEASNYVGSLVDYLQGALDLPEMGAVKVELKLKNDGSFTRMRVLQTGSNRNRLFLENELPQLKYPAFNGGLKNEKEHAFVITFCNE